MSDWQPIESAPRDGSWFVTVNANARDPEYEVGRYQPYEWNRFVEVGEGLFRQQAETVSEFTQNNWHRATHWMPLPTPPSTSGE